MANCPYTLSPVYDAGDGIRMCDMCDCWGWSPGSLPDETD